MSDIVGGNPTDGNISTRETDRLSVDRSFGVIKEFYDSRVNLFHNGLGGGVTGGLNPSDFEDPTYLGIHNLLFTLDSDSSPLFANTVSDIKDRNKLSGAGWGTAKQYLLNNGYYGKAALVDRFRELVRQIFIERPYYVKSIAGLKKFFPFPEEGGVTRTKDAKLDIEFYESIDNRVSLMIDLYRQIVYDWENMKYILPRNLRWFQLVVTIKDPRLFWDDASINLHFYNNAGSSKGIFDMNSNMPIYVFNFTMCEFNIEESFSSFDTITNETSETPVEQKLSIIPGKLSEHFSFPIHSLELTSTPEDYMGPNARDAYSETVSSSNSIFERLSFRAAQYRNSFRRVDSFTQSDNIVNPGGDVTTQAPEVQPDNSPSSLALKRLRSRFDDKLSTGDAILKDTVDKAKSIRLPTLDGIVGEVDSVLFPPPVSPSPPPFNDIEIFKPDALFLDVENIFPTTSTLEPVNESIAPPRTPIETPLVESLDASLTEQVNLSESLEVDLSTPKPFSEILSEDEPELPSVDESIELTIPTQPVLLETVPIEIPQSQPIVENVETETPTFTNLVELVNVETPDIEALVEQLVVEQQELERLVESLTNVEVDLSSLSESIDVNSNVDASISESIDVEIKSLNNVSERVENAEVVLSEVSESIDVGITDLKSILESIDINNPQTQQVVDDLNVVIPNMEPVVERIVNFEKTPANLSELKVLDFSESVTDLVLNEVIQNNLSPSESLNERIDVRVDVPIGKLGRIDVEKNVAIDTSLEEIALKKVERVSTLRENISQSVLNARYLEDEVVEVEATSKKTPELGRISVYEGAPFVEILKENIRNFDDNPRENTIEYFKKINVYCAD